VNGVFIMAAAVSDYRPREMSSSKLKKAGERTMLELVANPDILAEMAKRKKNAIHVGFAVETDNGIANATQKLHKKKLDMIVLNNPKEPGAGFGTDTNKVKFIFTQDKIEDIPLMDKRLVAYEILKRIVSLRKARQTQKT
jgi:phosphopantothenoylcysteine decarboxylase/phosphopantothenate--cysteine ligase